MSLAIIKTRASVGVDAPEVWVEIHLASGLPAFNIVGLPETTVKESKERVRSAIANLGLKFPAKRITVNLAPADLPKEGGRYDLAIALGILGAADIIDLGMLDRFELYGELGLAGDIRPIHGILPAMIATKRAKRSAIIPHHNEQEAALTAYDKLHPCKDLGQVLAYFFDDKPLPAISDAVRSQPWQNYENQADMADVKGQFQAKRAMSIAAAGGHHLLMVGPPGTGKSMLAKRMPSIMPPLTEQQALDVASLYSIQGAGMPGWLQRPFRSPHHTASAAALAGGGSKPKPGEISLAHHGVLFLDELPEFSRKTIEILREPMEAGEIWIARAKQSVCYPAQFQLVAAMNPSAKGEFDAKQADDWQQVARYSQKISKPILDRIDLQIWLSKLPHQDLIDSKPAQTSEQIRQHVSQTYQTQLTRQNKLNAALTPKELEHYCKLDNACQNLLEKAMQKLNLSPRSYHRIIRVARTIADLDNQTKIQSKHISEALSYRQLEKIMRGEIQAANTT